ncbi:MAG: GDP-mannose 4,6-dehydratase [Candidatus Omnitrophica bacterium]|jgi:UDP-glucose 4-epimerase|nr:GDP-mannose 4,6-dehydratase [Candidatus Omnitrophota bacterium]
MKEKILVTGGAGFIGSHIIEDLLKEGYRVAVYDNFSSGRRENLSAVIDDIELIEADILDYETLKKSAKGCDIISHQAAQLEIFKCLDDPIADLEVNTIGTLNVFKAAVANEVKKVINASSACVYGQANYIPQDEEHPKNPNWPYGVSKLAAEKYAAIYHQRHNIDIFDLRYAIIYGEREWLGRVLTMFLIRALQGKAPVVFGKGEQLRDFTYVKDVVKLNNLLLKDNIKGHRVYNVSTGIGTSISELAKIVIQVAGLDCQPIFEEVAEGKASRFMPERKRIPSELDKMVLSYKKAKKDLDWSPKLSLREGIKREYEWIKKNQKFWRIEGEIKV